MCGRFVGNFNTHDLFNEMNDAVSDAGFELDLPDTDSPLLRNFNVAPTTAIPILRFSNGVVRLDIVRWGLLPIWSKDPSKGAQMINARSETITEKPSFRGLVKGHRCVTRSDGHLMLGAGLWSESPIVEEERTCALITRDSTGDLDFIHDRSPVEFHAQEALEWLSSSEPPLELFHPEHQPRFATIRVSTRVNSVRNNDASLVLPDDEPTESSDLTLF
jgi:putative SOS response-associated peptidase YedK